MPGLRQSFRMSRVSRILKAKKCLTASGPWRTGIWTLLTLLTWRSAWGTSPSPGGEDYTLAIQQSGDLGGYRLNWSVEDGTLKIRDGSEGGHHIGFEELGTVFGKTAMDVVITVPDTARLGRVTAKSDMGDVFVSDLAAEKVTAETDMGDVQCYEVSGVKKLDLKSDMGDVTIGMGGLEDGVDIDLETSMGTVEANMGCYERDCAYEVKTDMGTVCVNGRDYGSKAEQKGNMPYKLDIEDDMGDVNVYFYTGQGG